MEKENDETEVVKTFEACLILNYKNGEMRILKKQPNNVSYSDIPINVKINVRVPRKEEMSLEGDITLSDVKVNQILLEQI